MITFKRILFPVDFSDYCRAVVPCVKAMAERFGSQVVVLHVIDLPQSWLGSPEAAAWSALINADRLRLQAKVGRGSISCPGVRRDERHRRKGGGRRGM